MVPYQNYLLNGLDMMFISRKTGDMMNLSGIRKEVFQAEAYVPGKSMEDVKLEYGLRNVIKLGSNENPYSPFPNVIKVISEELNKINIYPEANYTKLKELLGKKYGLTSEYIAIGHGAGGVLETLSRLFIESGDEVIVPTETYRLYREISKVMGGIVREIPLDDNYKINIGSIAKNINEKTKVIWICNPNNPTGTIVKKEELDKLVDSLPVNTWLVLDEAYAEFGEANDLPSSIEYVKNNKNVVVVRTFSKYYGLAGARMGYAIASPDIIKAFEIVSEPFNANRFGLAAAISTLTVDEKYCREALEKILKERTRVSFELEKENFQVTRSSCNFIFFKVPYDCDEVSELLLRRGVVVRPCDGWGYKNHIRVTIGTKEEMDIFLKELKAVIKKLSDNEVCVSV